MKPDRHTWIDYARGIAIVLVLYRHVFEGIKNSGIDVSGYTMMEQVNILFFSFRMPLFFIVSGIFVDSSLKKRGLSDFVGSKVRTILYPYFLWGGIQITLQILLSGYVNSQRSVGDYLYLFYLPRRIDQFWYLLALFTVSILYVLSTSVFRLRLVQNFILGIILYCFSFLAVQNGIVLGFLGDLSHYFLFYLIGVGISDIVRNEKNYRYLESWKTWLLLLPLFIYSQLFFLTQNLKHPTKYHDYVEYFQPFNFIMIALYGCVFIICLSFYLQKIRRLKFLEVLGRYSLYIYVSHVLVLASVRIIMTRVFHIDEVPVILVIGILSGLIIPVFLYKGAERFNMKWIFTLEKTREQTIKTSEIKIIKSI